MLAGLGLGWLLDRVAGTAPLGLIGGVLVGTAAAVFLVARSAGRMARTTEARTGIAPPSAFKDEDGLD